MKRHIHSSQHEQQSQAAHAQDQRTEAAPREFATGDEMLRHDRLHTPVPPSLADRLHESIRAMPPEPRRSWWRRLLGR